ncbi:MAG TPA: TIGR00725 family protein, partial [Tepidisphaeraceae bacterium]|nr:TIGR00725 family protein [Tepidisphaeraceae bacterium]
MRSRRTIIGVIGAGTCDAPVSSAAFAVGKALALRGCILITGGRSGVMKAASEGAASAGGLVIGILPGESPDEANEFVDVPVVTGLGEARNVIIARTADGLIAITGEYGTLSEIAFGLKFGKPVVSLNSWSVDARIQQASSPEDAVNRVLAALDT